MRAKGARLVVVIEGLDVLREGGTVERVAEHLNPPGSRGSWPCRDPTIGRTLVDG
jgi:polyphosphate kinase 2 (PPK2 family)